MPFYHTDENGCPKGKAISYAQASGLNQIVQSMYAAGRYNDLICSCEGRMVLMPIKQRGTLWCPAEYHECSKCQRRVFMDEIVDAFQSTQIEFEEAFEQQEIFFVAETGNVSVENIQQEGTRRWNLTRKHFTVGFQVLCCITESSVSMV
jgi:hypothetical protein